MLKRNFKGIDYILKVDGTILATLPDGTEVAIKRTSKRYKHLLYAFKVGYLRH